MGTGAAGDGTPSLPTPFPGLRPDASDQGERRRAGSA